MGLSSEKMELLSVAKHIAHFYPEYSFEPAEPSGFSVLHQGEVIGIGETPLDVHRVIIVHAGEVEPKGGCVRLKGLYRPRRGFVYSKQPR